MGRNQPRWTCGSHTGITAEFADYEKSKNNNDYKEMDALRRLLESTARIKKYSNGGGNEADLN